MNKNRWAAPAAVEPAPAARETERPNLVGLTAVIAVCFAVGVAWPIFGGIEFVQRPPGSSAAKPPTLDPVPAEADPGSGGALGSGEVAAAHGAPMLTMREAVRIEGQTVQSCQGDTGEARLRCDAPNLEGVIEDPIAKLADCSAADGVAGALSLGLELDFARGHVTGVKAGQSTTLPKPIAARLIACAEELIVGTPLDDIEHEHSRYWVYYRVRFLPPGTAIDPASAPPPEQVVSASGQATIGYTTAIVRDGPSPRAKVAERLSYGTRVNVTGRAGDWYRIERSGKSLGWVHRKAIGM